jgi:hypothetical protein
MPVQTREGTEQTGTRVQRAADTIPTEMRAAAIDRFGGPEVLTLQVLPVPAPDATEVLIAIDTAGIGSWDADMRGGVVTERANTLSARAGHGWCRHSTSPKRTTLPLVKWRSPF